MADGGKQVEVGAAPRRRATGTAQLSMSGALLSQVVEHPNPVAVGILRSELPKVVDGGSEILDDESAAFLPLRMELIDLRCRRPCSAR